MGWTFLNTDTLPEPGDIVWCKFPYSRGEPGPIARPTLVRATATYENPETGTLYGSVEVSYGTGEYTEDQCQVDLIGWVRMDYQIVMLDHRNADGFHTWHVTDGRSKMDAAEDADRTCRDLSGRGL